MMIGIHIQKPSSILSHAKFVQKLGESIIFNKSPIKSLLLSFQNITHDFVLEGPSEGQLIKPCVPSRPKSTLDHVAQGLSS